MNRKKRRKAQESKKEQELKSKRKEKEPSRSGMWDGAPKRYLAPVFHFDVFVCFFMLAYVD